MNLKGTKTAVNLMKAFAGESQARMRYTYYASVADKEGYKQIRNIFLETADNEKEHAKRFYKFLLAGLDELPADIEIQASFPVAQRSEEHTSELQSRPHLVCRLLLEKKKNHATLFESRAYNYTAPLPHTSVELTATHLHYMK